MNPHYDPTEVIAALDKAMAIYRTQVDDPGSIGAQCRLGLAAQKPLQLALIAEINRCTTSAHIFQAMASFMANTLLTLIQSAPEDGTLPNEPSERMEVFFAMHTEALMMILGGLPGAVGSHTTVSPKEAGRA